MASNMENTSDSTQFTIEELKRETNVTNQQLDTRIEQPDLPMLASYFDNINDGYLEAMNLTPGQQTDARERAHVSGTLAGMMLALTLWLNSQLVRGTFRALIVILLSLDKRLVAVQVFKYLSKKDFPSPPGLSQERNHRLSSYRDYLQSFYRKLKLSSTTQWPPVSTNKVIKLAMIHKEKIQRGRMDDEFVRLTITGKIDDILLKKKPAELKDIFANTEEDERKIMLIEGAPGSGKSTLALHICQEWTEGKLFQDFDITILVRLRDPLIKDAKTIADILPCVDRKMAIEQEIVIKALYGKGVLWVLDGWDELPSYLPRDSIINKLIPPGWQQESPLHESTVIVTSRPSSSAKLHPLVSSRVEVLGFTPQKLEQYFTECLNGDSQAVQTLLDRIRENPAVESSCYLPLNASIVVNSFLSDNHSLPKTNHEIFTSLVQSFLKRYLQEKLGKTTATVGNITSPNSLPMEICIPFKQMCQLAYHGIDQNKVTFTNKDFTTFSITENISNIGLLQSVPSILGNDQLVYYCFLHLSIQELLAAIHISLMSSKDQISVFDNLFGQPRFSAVFQFYAGITKLKTSRRFLSKLPQPVFRHPTAILDLVRKIVSECKMKYYKPKPLLLSLMNCLYEAEDMSLYAFVVQLLKHKLDLGLTTMNPIDCHSVGYFTSISTKPFSLCLPHCSIGDQGCKFLARGLLKRSHSHCNINLNLDYNDINCEGIQYIGEILTNTTLLTEINLSHNEISDSGLNILCDALSTNTSLTHLTLRYCSLTLNNHGAIPRLLSTNTKLQHLDLSHNIIGNIELSNLCDALSDSTNTSLKTLDLTACSLTISDDNGAALYQPLSKNNSLENLQLSRNTVTSCHHIAAGLAVNKTLRILNLAKCKLTDRSIEELSTGLINNIEELNIYNNDSITENGVKTLARHLTTHCPKLNSLCIPRSLLSCIDTVFRETNEKRKRNGLTEINPFWTGTGYNRSCD